MKKFDLVDTEDNVIGITNKEESHKNGHIHRVVAIYVFTTEGKLYVQEHIKSDGLFDHSVGGHVHKGESYDQAAKREGKEELGLRDNLTKISIFYSDETFFGAKSKHIFALYECYPSKHWKFKPNEEVKNIFPLTIEETVNLMNKDPKKFTPGFLNTMREYIKQKHLNLILKQF